MAFVCDVFSSFSRHICCIICSQLNRTDMDSSELVLISTFLYRSLDHFSWLRHLITLSYIARRAAVYSAVRHSLT